MTESVPAPVTLRAVSPANVRAVCDLQVAEAQRRFVATSAQSIAEAYFAPEAWFRAIYAGDEPVGFVMLSVKPEVPEYAVWRLLVDARHQRRGYGAAAMAQVCDLMREWGAREVLLSYVPGDGNPEPFYRSLGFEPTGQVEGGEIVLRRSLG